MSEVVEINIVSRKKYPISDLLKFISLQMNNSIIKKTITAVDNWQYENAFEITEENDIEKFIDNKIICIAEELSIGQAGIDIEVLNNHYTYCVWFNWKSELSYEQYTNIIDNFIDYVSNSEMIDDISICAIGKEVIFEYLNDIKKTISTAHNIDVWLLGNEVYN